MYYIGLDAGSVTVKVVVLDKNGDKLAGHYVRHYGNPAKSAIEILKGLKHYLIGSSLSITGSAGKLIASALNIAPVNEIVAQSYSIRRLFPHIGTIIELGGEDSKLIILEHGNIKDFSMNSVCAAGTGSFLEQQAERLRLSIEEFSDTAVLSERPSKIAGRCSVFAKSDMIHLQQIATPVEDIVAGLCFAVARNFKGVIAKGRELRLPVAFQGGVAANKGVVRAFKEVFELDELFVPPDFALMGAIGAALKDLDEGRVNAFDPEKIEALLSSQGYSDEGCKPLINSGCRIPQCASQSRVFAEQLNKTRAYLGIDIGSISTNLAVIDDEGNLLAKQYLMTAGRPIEAVKQGLREIHEEISGRIEIAGVGATGSGRYMIADYVGADIVKNEITAQATAAIYIDPEVDTIFEIGGQDSKYISIRDGIIVDFEMNKACAAGTGSFIEEQAEKLDISVKGEFADCAFSSNSPCRLGERCTVFMENSLMSNIQRGVDKNDLLAGLAYSIVMNYINRVVAGKPVGEKIFFQGGVAFNESVVAAFESYVGRKIIVPPNHDVTGAIGMALIVRDHMKAGNEQTHMTIRPATSFKGFELSERRHEISSFECSGCSNVCQINRVKVEGEDGSLFYGGRCEKYDVRKKQRPDADDLFEFRTEMLWKEHRQRTEEGEKKTEGREKAVKIGIPYIFFMHDYLPFWSTFLWELGFEAVVSPMTNKHIVNLGLENAPSD
ncbi:MAG: acyl-CoA dehydratase activase, partial [Nitrospirae bacterium]|nr:acyl-CoA dehydratase activase [Nitrospirota bacterium]